MANSHMDIGNLNESQQLALGTYSSVTNQEPAQAIPLLQRSEWNVKVSHIDLATSSWQMPVTNPASDRYCQILRWGSP